MRTNVARTARYKDFRHRSPSVANLRVGGFVVEQPPLAFKTSAVASECAGGTDDAMAGHDNGNRIGAVRQSHGAARG